MRENIGQSIIHLIKSKATPFYFIDIDSIIESAREFRETWKAYFPHVEVAYSFKTNSLKSITQALAQDTFSAEVVSGAELLWAIEDGFESNKIYFDGPLKLKSEILFAINNRIKIQVDSLDELSDIIRYSKELGVNCHISLRLTANYREKSDSRFGLKGQEFLHALELLKMDNMSLGGLHIHVGSNVEKPEKYTTTLKRYIDEIKQAISVSRGKLWLDLGGGYPARSVASHQSPTPLKYYVQEIYNFFIKNNLPVDIHLVLEPGRCLVEDHGYYVTKIHNIKNRGKHTVVVLDGGINHVSSMRSWYHPMYLLDSSNQIVQLKESNHTSGTRYHLYGSNCFESDIFMKNVSYSKQLYRGNCIIVGSAGGYDLPSANVWIRSAPPIYASFKHKLIIARRTNSSSEIRANQIGLEAEHVPD